LAARRDLLQNFEAHIFPKDVKDAVRMTDDQVTVVELDSAVNDFIVIPLPHYPHSDLPIEEGGKSTLEGPGLTQ